MEKDDGEITEISKGSDKEHGIRVFFKEGDHQDFDPIKDHEYGYEGKIFWVNDGNRFEYAANSIGRVVSYEVTNEKRAGMYVRIFEDDSAVRHPSDLVKKVT